MNRTDDYLRDMVRELNEGADVRSETVWGAADESDLLTRFLLDLRELGEGPVPAPSAELSAAFDSTPPVSRRLVSAASGLAYRRRMLAVGAVAAATVAATGAAAAAHDLPVPAQRFVSRVIQDVTPFTIDPAGPDKPHQAPGSGTGTVRPVLPGAGEPDDGTPSVTAPSGDDGAGGGSDGNTGGASGSSGDGTGGSGDSGGDAVGGYGGGSAGGEDRGGTPSGSTTRGYGGGEDGGHTSPYPSSSPEPSRTGESQPRTSPSSNPPDSQGIATGDR